MLDKQPLGEGRGGFGRGDGCARWRSWRWWQCLGSCYQTWLSRQRRKGQLYWRKLPFFHPFVLGSVLILIMQQLKRQYPDFDYGKWPLINPGIGMAYSHSRIFLINWILKVDQSGILMAYSCSRIFLITWLVE